MRFGGALAAPMTLALAPPAEDRSTTFHPVEDGGGNTRSGTLLLVEAYAAIWLAVFVLILWSLRRQRRMDGRIARLGQQLERARADVETREAGGEGS